MKCCTLPGLASVSPLEIYSPLPFLIFLRCFSIYSPPSRLFCVSLSSQNNVGPGVFTSLPSGKGLNMVVVVGDYLWRRNIFLGGGGWRDDGSAVKRAGCLNGNVMLSTQHPHRDSQSRITLATGHGRACVGCNTYLKAKH